MNYEVFCLHSPGLCLKARIALVEQPEHVVDVRRADNDEVVLQVELATNEL